MPQWAAKDWLRGLILVAAVFLTYLPVRQAGFIWDDHEYITANPCMLGLHGLARIWTTKAADISPLTLTTFWVEHALWGTAPLPYHLCNVLLHGACAVLLWRVLRGLQVPGAWLGAALWALHPVQVESVAWITETKNAQSGAFFLLSVLCCLRWLRTKNHVRHAGGGWHYACTLIFAALAMASKSSTVILPATLCLCAWWMEGRWAWRNVFWVTPILLLSAAAGALSIWTQRLALAEARDPQWIRTYPERLITAGRAIWFYLGKLVWPHPLIANYPRWNVDAASWFSYLPFSAALGVLYVLWRRRETWLRPWFFVFLYLLTALLPILGLIDNPIFRFSFVFDHFQYLASMGPLALIGAGMARLARLMPPRKAAWQFASGTCLLLAVGTLSWRHSGVYRDEITLWRDTTLRNPEGWLGHDALGSALLLNGQADEAEEQYEKALRIHPGSSLVGNNLGVLLLGQGKIKQAIVHLEEAVFNDPEYADAHVNLGNAYLANAEFDRAIHQYKKAQAIKPDDSTACFGSGNALYAQGMFQEAIVHYEEALRFNPDYAEAHNNLGNAFLAKRELPQAVEHYEKALALNPSYAEARNNLGLAFLRMALFDKAVTQFQAALQLTPDHQDIRNNLAVAQRLARRSRPPQEDEAGRR